jgi:hypothetical protein
MTTKRGIALSMILLVGCAAPADSSLPSLSQRSQPSASSVLGETASAAPTSSATPAQADAELIVPGFATVTADRLLIRQEPGLTGEPLVNGNFCIDSPDPNCARPFVLGTASGYVELYVFDGPVTEEGYVWYLVATEMNTETHGSAFPEAVGWVAAGDDVDAWLVSASRSCPNRPVELADVTYLSLTRLEMLHCFGRQLLTLRGWYPSLPSGEQESNPDLEACRMERGWLPCYSIFDILRPEEGTWAGDAHNLVFAVDPDAGVTMPARSQWVEVTGSFDHPAASTCGDVAAMLNCRATFVISSAVVP